jgi:hypothetical protein
MNDEQFHTIRRDFLTLSRNVQSIAESLVVFIGIYENISESLYEISKKMKNEGFTNEKIKSTKKDKKSDA